MHRRRIKAGTKKKGEELTVVLPGPKEINATELYEKSRWSLDYAPSICLLLGWSCNIWFWAVFSRKHLKSEKTPSQIFQVKFVSLAWMIQTFPACTHVKQNPPAMLPPNPIYSFSCSAVLELQLAPAVATAGPREHPPASAALGEISLGSLHSKDFFHPFLKAQCDWRI